MKIKYKLILSSLLIVLVFMLAGYYINTEVMRMSQAQDDLVNAMRTDDASIEYLDGARMLQVGVYQSVHGNKEIGQQMIEQGKSQMNMSRILLRQLLRDPSMLLSLSDAEKMEVNVLKSSNDVIMNIDNKTISDKFLNDLQVSVEQFEGKLTDLDVSTENNLQAAIDRSTLHAKNTIQATYIGIFSALIIALILSFTMATIVTKPIKNLTDVANKVSKGEIGAKVSVESNDEIGELAESFKRMVNAFKIMDALSKEK